MSHPQRVNAGHLIDFAAAVYAGAGMPADDARLIAELKSVPLAKGFGDVFCPGAMEAGNAARNRAAGLQLADDTLTNLRRIARETRLKSRLPSA